MTLKGVDIAWARPTTAQIKAVGAHFVARYLSPDSSKNITAAEVKDYKANGLGVVVVWESTAGRMLGGYAAGHADAKAAEVQRAAVGLPNDQVIYFACDFDAQGAQYHTINEYMRGVNDVIGLSRSGFYGGYYAVENVASAPARASYYWQTVAWSGGKVSAHAHIYQSGGTTLGGGADWDSALKTDYGQYPRPQAPKPAPAPAPSTTSGGSVEPVQFWAYKNTSDKDPDQDAWGRLVETQRNVESLTAKVDALTAALAAIAKKVGI